MIERRQHARLALESRPPLGIRPEHPGQDLDCDIAPQLGVVGTEHFAHATGSQQRLDAVGTDLPADPHVRRLGRRAKECCRRFVRQQRLDLSVQFLVPGTLVPQKRVAVVRVAAQRLVIELEHPPPAISRHGQATGTEAGSGAGRAYVLVIAKPELAVLDRGQQRPGPIFVGVRDQDLHHPELVDRQPVGVPERFATQVAGDASGLEKRPDLLRLQLAARRENASLVFHAYLPAYLRAAISFTTVQTYWTNG